MESMADWKGKILPLRQQAQVVNGWLTERLDTVLPEIMTREGFDMWIVVGRENNEDPVLLTLVPEPALSARRRTILLYTLKDGELEKLVLARVGMGDLYQASWIPEQEDQWECLARLVKERDPKCIGINCSETFAFGDGLTHSEYEQMMRAFDPVYRERVKGAETLAVGWLERRTPKELNAYDGIVAIAHAMIAEAFSPRVVHPEVTTTQDVVWWLRQQVTDFGLRSWFQPSVSIQRQGTKEPDSVIRPGDLLHCDFGLVYLGLCTDTQQHAYVLRPDETEAPQGLRTALATGNRLQDIHAEAMAAGKTGNEILAAARAVAEEEGIEASIYTHPIGYHGHGAGPTIGLCDNQGVVTGRGDYRLFDDTCHSMELNIQKKVPEWDDQKVRIALEQDIKFTDGKVYFAAGRQTQFHLIR